MGAQISEIQKKIQATMNAADRKAEREEGELQPIKHVAVKGGGTITMYYSRSLGCYVTIPE